MPSFISRSLASALILCASAAAPAVAQSSSEPGRIELGAAWSALRDAGSDETLVTGWVASAGLRAQRSLWVIGEAGGHYKTLANDHEVRVHAFMGGLRFAPAASASVRPFAQVLVGVACYCGSDVDAGKAGRSLAIQPGVGLDFAAHRRVAFRVQADYRTVRDSDASVSQYRVAAGLVLTFGS